MPSSAIYANESVPRPREDAVHVLRLAPARAKPLVRVETRPPLHSAAGLWKSHRADLYLCQGLRFSIIYFL